MSEKQRILQEMRIIEDGDAWHGPSLKSVLADVTAAEAAAKPLADGHSIWELVLHIAAWEEVFARRLDGQIVAEPDEGDFPSVTDQKSWNIVVERLETAHAQLIGKVSNLKEADLEKIVPGKDFTIGFMVHGTVRHYVYHSGQIGLLKRLLRD